MKTNRAIAITLIKEMTKCGFAGNVHSRNALALIAGTKIEVPPAMSYTGHRLAFITQLAAANYPNCSYFNKQAKKLAQRFNCRETLALIHLAEDSLARNIDSNTDM